LETYQHAYDRLGNPLKKKHVHTASGKTTRTEELAYTYDSGARPTKVTHKLNSGSTVTLAEYTYDEFCRMATKTVNENVSGSKTLYAYNLHGWLVDIHHPYMRLELAYNNGTTGFNGNITKLSCSLPYGLSQNYSFTYDGLNRMLSADYSEGYSMNQNLDRYTEKVTEYDKNGNIKKLQRYGQTGSSTYGLVDNLTYTYNGNQLTRVDDATTATSYTGGTNFINGANTNNEYTYDQNGNLTKDLNKNISNIQYNSLNLPSVVTFSDGSTIRYMYSADGTKLRTTHVINGTTTTTDYCGNVIYENGTAKKLLTDGGYVDLTTTTPTYYYYLTDHQGNNRAVISASGSSVLETNHYYPFGGLFSTSTNVQPYKYNGKELDTKKGLNLYDYGARHYDAALGRWHVVDPKAEKMGAWSPYGYCYNNPMRYIDPNGQDGWDVVVGYGIRILTNIIPGTGNLRDAYTPTDASDYNGALRGADNISMAVGAAMVADGGQRTLSGTSIVAAGAAMTVGSGGVLAEAGVPVIVAGSTQAGVGAVEAATGGLLMYNAASNSKDGYERGKQSNVSSGNKNSPNANQKAKSINQLQKDVEKGRAPKGIERFDSPKVKGEQEHVHFEGSGNNALNKDGTWKHGNVELTKKQIEYLKENGWKTP